MNLYKRFLKRKQKGESLSLEDLSETDLKILFIDEKKSDKMIATLFEVNDSKIISLRQKYGITIKNSLINDFLDNNTDIAKTLNDKMKLETLADKNISKISKAITHFIFRNGPIEDMHADVNKNITDEDMKILNKYIVNRIAYIFTLISKDQWAEFNFLIESIDLMFGHDWDEAIPDDGGIKDLFENEIGKLRD